MPSPIGHALGGAAVALIADLWPGRPVGRLRFPLTCAALAAVPDVDLLLPIAHRTMTHSLGAVAFMTIIAAAVTGKVTEGRWRITLACGAAYTSHLLLDWLQADPRAPYGIQALWPLSSTWFISGWNVFRATERRHILEWASMRSNFLAVVQEIAILGPVVLALWLVRVKALARLAAELSRGDHPPQ
jgi:inner membrane protein